MPRQDARLRTRGGERHDAVVVRAIVYRQIKVYPPVVVGTGHRPATCLIVDRDLTRESPMRGLGVRVLWMFTTSSHAVADASPPAVVIELPFTPASKVAVKSAISHHADPFPRWKIAVPEPETVWNALISSILYPWTLLP